MSDERTDTYTEVTEEPGYLDRVVDAVSSVGEAVEHAAKAGYHYATEQYHVHAAESATVHGDMPGTQEHLDKASTSMTDYQIELNAARDAVGMESVDYDPDYPADAADQLDHTDR